MCEAAVRAGLMSLGFSGHAHTSHDESYCMPLSRYGDYYREVMNASERFSGELAVYVGLEQDYFSSKPTIRTDYIIGSVHYVKKSGVYIPVDETREQLLQAVRDLYGGDIYAFLEDYYALEADIYNKTGCDIVGHIDLCEKFNGDGSVFDRTHPRYIEAYSRAVEKLVSQGCVFEINTGAMSRGYTDFPYPQSALLRFIKESGGAVTVSSDTHSADTVNYKLDEMSALAKACGFETLRRFDGRAFDEISIE